MIENYYLVIRLRRSLRSVRLDDPFRNKLCKRSRRLPSTRFVYKRHRKQIFEYNLEYYIKYILHE